MTSQLGRHAVVIGGSMAGLMTARVLADHFARVTVIERDSIPEGPVPHKSVPQGHHLHVLLVGGEQVLSSLYPGFAERLCELGAVRWRIGKEGAFVRPDGKTYTSALGTVREPRDLGLDAFNQSRGLIEHCVRQFTRATPGIAFETESAVQALIHENGRVRGVRHGKPGDSRSVEADLVVDTSGRGSRTPRWLAELGYPAPEETAIGCDLAYASTRFRVPDACEERERLLGFFGPAPDYPNGAMVTWIENNLWQVTLAGRFGQFPPTDEAGFLAFAKALHSPKLHDLIKDAERVTDIVPYRYPSSVHRHYERLAAFPAGYLVLGDAICNFNPVYGQGMSSAAQQARALQQLLKEPAALEKGLDGLAPAFFGKTAQVVAAPWTFAASADLAYPQTTGDRSGLSKEGAAYLAAVGELVSDDPEVHKLVVQVQHLATPMSTLFEEPLRSRVAARMAN